MQTASQLKSRRWWGAVSDFFFAEEVPYTLALLRMTLPPVLLVPVLMRWPHVRELYSTDGAPTPLWINFGHPHLLPVPTAAVAVALYNLLLFALLATMAGWWTGLSLAVTTVLYTYFTLLDSITTMTKYTVIASHVLLLLSLSGCGAVWSIDAWLAPSDRTLSRCGPPLRRRVPVWPRKLIVILLGVVYLGAAATKMHTPGYFSGDQMAYWMLTNLNMANPLGERLSLYPAWLVTSSYFTIIWEITFLFICWRGWGRTVCILLGYVFHLLTWLLLGLVIFPLLYVVLYLALFGEADIQRLAQRLRRFERRHAWWARIRRVPKSIRWPAPPQLSGGQSRGAWGAIAFVAMLASVEVEKRLDVYRQHGGRDRMVLQPIAPERLSMLLHETPGVRPVDKMFAFDVGTELLGEVLMDRRREFTQGEQAVVQCSLEPSHEDLFVEVQMRDGNDRILKRGGVVVPRENLRGNLFYSLDGSLAPGEYSFVMRIDGEEVARKHVLLKPAS